jgi:hypothetical protein
MTDGDDAAPEGENGERGTRDRIVDIVLELLGLL